MIFSFLSCFTEYHSRVFPFSRRTPPSNCTFCSAQSCFLCSTCATQTLRVLGGWHRTSTYLSMRTRYRRWTLSTVESLSNLNLSPYRFALASCASDLERNLLDRWQCEWSASTKGSIVRQSGDSWQLKVTLLFLFCSIHVLPCAFCLYMANSCYSLTLHFWLLHILIPSSTTLY